MAPRAVTHLVAVPGGDDGTVIVGYDRMTGLATAFPATAAPRSPSTVWSSATSAVVSASLSGPGAEHPALQQALDGAAAAWQARGGAPWRTVLDLAAQQALWAAATDPGTVEGVLARLGLPAAPPTFAASMAAVPTAFVATLVLPAELAAKWRAGDGADVGHSLIDVLAASGTAAAVGLVTTTDVALVAAVTSLPGAGLNLSGRSGVGYRWYCLPIEGLPGRVTPAGAATVFQPAADGLSALVVLGYQRIGLADPYEILLNLPDGAVLTPEQYEFLLNVADRAAPAGIQINTLALRQRHLDLDGDGAVDPLPLDAGRVYRRFRHSTLR
jgi:hypothetical protein